MSCANQFMFLYVLCLSMLKTLTPAPGSNQSLYTLLLLFKTKNLTNGVELVAVLDGDFSKGLQMYFEGNSISYNNKL